MNHAFDQVAAAIVKGQSIDAFNDPLSRLCVRNWKLGIHDELTTSTILSRVRSRQAKIDAGEVVPFRRARFNNGDICVGRDLADGWQRQGEIWLPKSVFRTPWLICARTGHGKSVLEANLSLGLSETGVNTWQFCFFKNDLLGQLPRFHEAGLELVVLRAEDLKFNPLQAGPNDPAAHLTAVATRLAECLDDLPPRAEIVLRGVCHQLYREFGIFDGQRERWPHLFHAYEKIHASKGLNPAAKDALLDRLGSHLEQVKPGCGAWLKGWLSTDLAKRSVLFLFRRVAESLKRFLVDDLIDHVFQHQIERGVVNRDLELFIFVDDAQSLVNAPGRSTLGNIEKKVGTIRGGGTSIGFLPQSPLGVSPHLLGNINAWVMGQVDHDARMLLARNMSLNASQIEFLGRPLERGQYVARVTEGDWHETFLFESDHVDLAHNVTEQDIIASQACLQSLPVIADDEFQRWERHPLVELQPQSTTPTLLSPPETRLLNLVVAEPGKATGYYTRKLGMNGKAARTARERLVQLGLLREHRVQLNPRGKASLVLLPGPDTASSNNTFTMEAK